MAELTPQRLVQWRDSMGHEIQWDTRPISSTEGVEPAKPEVSVPYDPLRSTQVLKEYSDELSQQGLLFL